LDKTLGDGDRAFGLAIEVFVIALRLAFLDVCRAISLCPIDFLLVRKGEKFNLESAIGGDGEFGIGN